MNRKHSTAWILVGGSLLLLCAGCKMPSLGSPDFLNDFWPYGKSDTRDTARYGPTPAMRIAAIRKQAEGAEKRSPDEQQRVVAGLAQQIRTEGDPLVRIAILETVAAYPGPLASQILKAGLRDDNHDVRVASCEAWGNRPGPESVSIMGTTLSSESDIDVRLAAARALGKLHDPAAVQALSIALEDRQDPALQYRAVQSLHELTGKDLGNDLAAWRQYCQNPQQMPERPQSSVAESALFWWR